MAEHKTVEDFGLVRTSYEGIVYDRFLFPFTGPLGDGSGISGDVTSPSDSTTSQSESASPSGSSSQSASPSRSVSTTRSDSSESTSHSETSDWQLFRVTLGDGQHNEFLDDNEVLHYGINSVAQTLLVAGAYLQAEDGSSRYTEMRLWQMLADCWTASGNAAEELRYVGFYMIVNADVREAMDEVWANQASQAEGPEYGSRRQRMLTILADNAPVWNRNPFARSGTRLARQLSTADMAITCEEAHLVMRDEALYYMVLEFKNGERDEESSKESECA